MDFKITYKQDFSLVEVEGKTLHIDFYCDVMKLQKEYSDFYFGKHEVNPEESKIPETAFGTKEELLKAIATTFVSNPDLPFRQVVVSFLRGYGWFSDHLYGYLKYAVQPEPEEGGKISYYRDYKDFCRGRRTTQKFGRFVRALGFEVDDVTLETMVKDWQRKFTKEDYTLHVGDCRADFAKAYGDDLAKSKDPVTSCLRKSLHNSCMRGITCYGVSPAEVYASGDFKIAWVENPQGEIAGRVVYSVHRDIPQSGPIYGVCEQSLDMLQEHLLDIEADPYNKSSWEGAKILHLVDRDGDIIGPYSDLETGVVEKGDYLVITDSNGTDFCMSSTSGYMSGQKIYCDYCEVYHSVQDMTEVDYVGYVCDSCLDEGFLFSELEGRYIRDYQAVEYFQYTSTGRVVSDFASTGAGELVYCECVDEFWHEDSVTFSDHIEGYVPTQYAKDHPELMGEEQEKEAG